jgi:tyrosyl-tRNA synthetase
MNFIEELKWRGMLHDMMPGIEEQLQKECTAGYVGFDPTADSLHIGNLVPIMMLVHFQRCGHKPFALIGGATGMVGDPSGKSEERNLLDEETLQKNVAGVKKQLTHFLNFSEGDNAAELVNNYDWFKHFNFLDFIRDAGKHITVNYMLAKDSVKKRLETGLSFTEFSYQLVQGYDFFHLNKNNQVKVQMGGSDQWGNITTGTELVRRMKGGDAFAVTCPLITKADGGKFGKSESGNIWLDRDKTSPYKFYQFWLNAADEDLPKYLRIFSLKEQAEIEAIEAEHALAPHTRIMQHALVDELTVRVHSTEDLETAKKASQILFGKSTSEDLKSLSEQNLLDVFEGVPQGTVAASELAKGISVIDFLSDHTEFLKSKGEARRALKENSIAINKEKVNEESIITQDNLIAEKYILAQRGKKNYFLVKIN